jgi:hypothetical protein
VVSVDRTGEEQHRFELAAAADREVKFGVVTGRLMLDRAGVGLEILRQDEAPVIVRLPYQRCLELARELVVLTQLAFFDAGDDEGDPDPPPVATAPEEVVDQPDWGLARAIATGWMEQGASPADASRCLRAVGINVGMDVIVFAERIVGVHGLATLSDDELAEKFAEFMRKRGEE